MCTSVWMFFSIVTISTSGSTFSFDPNVTWTNVPFFVHSCLLYFLHHSLQSPPALHKSTIYVSSCFTSDPPFCAHQHKILFFLPHLMHLLSVFPYVWLANIITHHCGLVIFSWVPSLNSFTNSSIIDLSCLVVHNSTAGGSILFCWNR